MTGLWRRKRGAQRFLGSSSCLQMRHARFLEGERLPFGFSSSSDSGNSRTVAKNEGATLLVLYPQRKAFLRTIHAWSWQRKEKEEKKRKGGATVGWRTAERARRLYIVHPVRHRLLARLRFFVWIHGTLLCAEWQAEIDVRDRGRQLQAGKVERVPRE